MALGTKPLSLKEENRLYGISVVPAVIVAFVVAYNYGYSRMPYVSSQVSFERAVMWDTIFYLWPPLFVLGPAAFFVTYEILRYRMQGPIGFNIKRLVGRMATIVIFGLVFILVYLAAYFFLVPVISVRYAMLSSGLLMMLLLIAVVSKFQAFFTKLGKGEW